MLNQNILITLFLLANTLTYGQQADESMEYISAEATITSLESRTNKNGRHVTAHVDFITQEGDSISSQLLLDGLPIIGSLKSVGDKVNDLYKKDNPGLIQTPARSILTRYAWPIFIVLIVLCVGYQLYHLVKNRKNLMEAYSKKSA